MRSIKADMEWRSANETTNQAFCVPYLSSAMLVSASSCLSPFLVLRKAESKSEAKPVGSSNAQMSVKTIKPGVLTVGTNPDLEPLSYYDENGKLTGF